MTKEEPLIRQLVRTRALNSRDGSLSPTRRPSHASKGGGLVARSMSQPPRPRPQPPVYTLQLLPFSLVYPPTPNKVATPKVSFCSVSQPDLTKLVTTPTVTNSLCSTPLSMNLSRCGSPVPPTLSPYSTPPPGTPPNWAVYNPQDLNNNNEISVQSQVQNQVCQCPKVQQNTCFSSLCCEICKLFPEKLDNYPVKQTKLLPSPPQQSQQQQTNYLQNVENEQSLRYVHAYRWRFRHSRQCRPLSTKKSTML